MVVLGENSTKLILKNGLKNMYRLPFGAGAEHHMFVGFVKFSRLFLGIRQILPFDQKKTGQNGKSKRAFQSRAAKLQVSTAGLNNFKAAVIKGPLVD